MMIFRGENSRDYYEKIANRLLKYQTDRSSPAEE